MRAMVVVNGSFIRCVRRKKKREKNIQRTEIVFVLFVVKYVVLTRVHIWGGGTSLRLVVMEVLQLSIL